MASHRPRPQPSLLTNLVLSRRCVCAQAERVRLACEDGIVVAAAGGLAATPPVV